MANDDALGPVIDAEFSEVEDAILAVNRRTLACEWLPNTGRNEHTTITVVLKQDHGDYAAYQGMGSPYFVAQHGDKLSFEEACIHFPLGLERERYRT